MWLKRTTPQNIVIGGAAGSIPPMVGWVAVTGSLSIPAVYLFVIIFLWTPPHFWALALLIQKDYERAGVPMLPVVSSRKYTTSNIFVYSLVLVAATLGFTFTQAVDWIYLGVALPLGIMFIALAWRLTREYTARHARHIYLLLLAIPGIAVRRDDGGQCRRSLITDAVCLTRYPFIHARATDHSYSLTCPTAL